MSVKNIRKLGLYIILYPFLVLFSCLAKLLSSKLIVTKHKIKIRNLPKQLRGLKIAHLTDFHYDTLPTMISPLNKLLPPFYAMLSRKEMERVVRITNGLKPDIIALTGDYVQVDTTPIHELCQKFLSKLECRGPRLIFATLGNHDIKQNKAIIIDALEKANICVLEQNSEEKYIPIVRISSSQGMKVEPIDIMQYQSIEDCPEFDDDNGIEIVGFLDGHDRSFRAKYETVLKFYGHEKFGGSKTEIPKTSPFRLVLLHNPDCMRFLNMDNVHFDLLLAGHSHAGQVCIPVPSFLYPRDSSRTRLESNGRFWIYYPVVPIFVRLFSHLGTFVQSFLKKHLLLVRRLLYAVQRWEYAIGLHRTSVNNQGYIYTSAGIGSHLPGRMFCNPEIALFELESEDDDDDDGEGEVGDDDGIAYSKKKDA